MIEDQKKRKDFYENVFFGEEFIEGSHKVKNYLDKFSEEPHYGYIADWVLRKNFKSVLEIGVGGGLTLKHIHEKCPNMELIGMDISKKSIERARSNFKEWNMDVELFVGDAYDMPNIKDNQYDAVLMIDLIEHLENPVKALKVANRIARHEVIINVPSRQSIWTLLSPKLREKIIHLETVVQYWLGHQRLYTYKSLEDEVNQAGMVIVDYRSIRFISMSIYPFWRLKHPKSVVIWLYKASIKLEQNIKYNPKYIGNSILASCRGK
jgi:ubiquinone/menaquinone biosynthesis C-methylase UbiE